VKEGGKNIEQIKGEKWRFSSQILTDCTSKI
jgi:hypothetical protein